MITREEFIVTVQGSSPTNGDMYVHFDEIARTILGVAIYNVNEEVVDLTDLLSQVQEIHFSLSKGSESQRVSLIVQGIESFNTFTHCDVVPYSLQISIVDNDTVPYVISKVQFIPAILEKDYYNSDYNAVHNNVHNQQKSTFIQVSERTKQNNQPSNLNAILLGTAQKAEIPDSNYTTSGWIQARYLGSTTDVNSYGNIPGALAGSTFIGSLHPPTTPTGSVCALASYDRVLETFIHTGEGDYPGFEVGKRFKSLTTQVINATDTILKGNLTNVTTPLAKYDLLLISSSTAQEIVRVLEYSVANREIYVERGIGDTNPTTFSPSTFNIYPVIRTQIYRITGNKAVALTDSWIWIKDSLNLVLTDKYGIVYRESPCQEIIYFRPQG